MCVNQKCMSVDSLRAMKSKCPQDCNGNGMCNSLGHCHCKDGFSPPFCDYPGPGGSEDSGPASDPNARKEFIMAMYIVFLGIIPVIAIVAFLMYYTKYNVNFKWQKTGGSTYVSNCMSRTKHVLYSACCCCFGKRVRDPTVPSLSHQVSKKTHSGSVRNINLEIHQTGLVSTTNESLLNASSSSNLLDVTVPKRRMSLKNIKGLKVDIKIKRNNDAHGSHSVSTPKTCETLCPEDETPALSVKNLANKFQNGGGSSNIC